MVKSRKDYDVPLRSMAFILYNAAKCDIKDPELFANYEKQMPYAPDMTLFRTQGLLPPG